MPEEQRCSVICEKIGDLADLKARMNDVERRCDNSDRQNRALEAWQNRALGYVMALSAMGTILINRFLK